MKCSREATTVLRPFIRRLWVADVTRVEPGASESVLPTGLMHLAWRLSGPPLTLLPGPDAAARAMSSLAVVGGARSSSYTRLLSPGRSVGLQLNAGAATLLLGAPAHELADRHTSLDDLWGGAAVELREQLAAISDPETVLDMLEQFLIVRLPRVHGIDPAIAHALDLFRRSAAVGEVVEQIGWSHRRFIARFRETVGISPKRFCRVRRLARVLRLAGRRADVPLAELAIDAGYSDQPHFNREFRDLTGMTPGEYRAANPDTPHHVPIHGRSAVNFVQDATSRARVPCTQLTKEDAR